MNKKELLKRKEELLKELNLIDKKILSDSELIEYVGKYLRIFINSNNSEYYIYVENVEKIFQGIRFYGKLFSKKDLSFYINIDEQHPLSIYYKTEILDSADITEISKEEFNKKIKEYFDEIFNIVITNE